MLDTLISKVSTILYESIIARIILVMIGILEVLSVISIVSMLFTDIQLIPTYLIVVGLIFTLCDAILIIRRYVNNLNSPDYEDYGV